MTDQPVDRPVDLRAELTSMLSVVDGNVSITREQMEAIGDHLQTLWGKAHDLKDNDALDIITSVWDRAQLLVEQNASLAFQVTGMGAVAVSALEGERATREALDNLEYAIDTNDDSHPKLQDFAESVREDVLNDYDERVQDTLSPEAYEAAYEDHSENYLDMITTITGCDWKAAMHFKSILDGFSKPTPEQVDLFRALVDSFAEPAQAASNGH